ncbi:MAG: hypothetical protein IPQ07_17020 [Myxococcales bacterium]|nr:hypothetical protein [Myxococcales bacterium]
MSTPVDIDGSRGEGGGQILRTSLALSLITGRPITMRNIRAGRAKPGLRRQHVACVDAAVKLCGGTVHGAKVDSKYRADARADPRRRASRSTSALPARPRSSSRPSWSPRSWAGTGCAPPSVAARTIRWPRRSSSSSACSSRGCARWAPRSRSRSISTASSVTCAGPSGSSRWRSGRAPSSRSRSSMRHRALSSTPPPCSRGSPRTWALASSRWCESGSRPRAARSAR